MANDKILDNKGLKRVLELIKETHFDKEEVKNLLKQAGGGDGFMLPDDGLPNQFLTLNEDGELVWTDIEELFKLQGKKIISRSKNLNIGNILEIDPEFNNVLFIPDSPSAPVHIKLNNRIIKNDYIDLKYYISLPSFNGNLFKIYYPTIITSDFLDRRLDYVNDEWFDVEEDGCLTVHSEYLRNGVTGGIVGITITSENDLTSEISIEVELIDRNEPGYGFEAGEFDMDSIEHTWVGTNSAGETYAIIEKELDKASNIPSMWIGTYDEYTNLENKDDNVMYLIKEENSFTSGTRSTDDIGIGDWDEPSATDLNETLEEPVESSVE